MRDNSKSIFFELLFVTLIICSPGCAHMKCDSLPDATSDQRLITLESLKASLPDHPIIAGFDIDDTVLFSSPGFNYGMTNTDGPGGKNKYGDVPLKDRRFWKDMNREYDKFSLPKEIGKALLKAHKDRGDKIFFITARTCEEEDRAVIENRLKAVFKLTDSPVVCTNETSKTKDIEKNGIDIYYGDADTDIEQPTGSGLLCWHLALLNGESMKNQSCAMSRDGLAWEKTNS